MAENEVDVAIWFAQKLPDELRQVATDLEAEIPGLQEVFGRDDERVKSLALQVIALRASAQQIEDAAGDL